MPKKKPLKKDLEALVREQGIRITELEQRLAQMTADRDGWKKEANSYLGRANRLAGELCEVRARQQDDIQNVREAAKHEGRARGLTEALDTAMKNLRSK